MCCLPRAATYPPVPICCQREVDGFDLDWYFFVAPAILTTMTLQIVAPFVVPLISVASHRFSRKRALDKAICQEEMDAAAM